MSTLDRVAFFAPILGLVWIAGGVLVSIRYRRQEGKPIIPRLPDDALFSERRVSGHSRKSLLTRFGGASRVLMVAVTADEFLVTPAFPFNLMFLPEIYGLEVRVPRSAAHVVEASAGLLGRNVVVSIDGAAPFEMMLRLRNQMGFLAAMSTQTGRDR